MLEDDEDILTQISAQLDIPSFADQEVSVQATGSQPGLHGAFLPPIEGLESGILDDVLMDDFSIGSCYPEGLRHLGVRPSYKGVGRRGVRISRSGGRRAVSSLAAFDQVRHLVKASLLPAGPAGQVVLAKSCTRPR